MKKFWKVKNNVDIRLCLEKLKLSDKYIEILLEDNSDFIEALYYYDQVYIGYNPYDRIVKNDLIFKGFGWCEDYDYYISFKYEYCGEVNLRKEKLSFLKQESFL